MTQNEVLEDADETYLKKVQITYGTNGYPKGLGEWAVIGFDYFEDAEEFAVRHGLEVKHFTSKYGWDFWNEGGIAYEPYTPDDYLNKLGDDYSYADSDDEFYIERMKEILNNSNTNYEELTEYLKVVEEIKMEVSRCVNGQKVIVYRGKYFETMEATMMGYSEDQDRYAIGVFVPHNLI